MSAEAAILREELEDAAWAQGHRAALVSVLRDVLRQLGYDDVEARRAGWISEREAAVVTLRRVCSKHGDDEWSDDLNLSDVIEKHLERHLDEPEDCP